MYLTLIFTPLIGSILSGFFGRFLGIKGSPIIATIGLSISMLLSYIAFFNFLQTGEFVTIEFNSWIQSGVFQLSWGFLFDSLTLMMLMTVTTISFLVHIFSIDYMKNDPHITRFMSYLSLFTFFMLILVSSDNLLQMFIGWEGVGLSSYLLIGFWYTRIEANKSAMKAMIVNRIGDFGFILGMIFIFSIFKSLHFYTLFNLIPLYLQTHILFLGFHLSVIDLITFLLFLAAMGKSAQLFLHTWLPDAMEGPTPVSALIHAATMVTAGVFLIIRCSPIFQFSSHTLTFMTIIGALTAFISATIGLIQNDLKKIIAYSTCSQLGYMIFSCGLSSYSTSLFHLVNHAFFKALLFLGAGSIIHAVADQQDIRKLGGLMKWLPFTYTMILIGSLSLMGFPFLTGFYSKDAILEIAFSNFTINATFAFWLGTISAFFTAFYSFRLIFLTFITRTNASKTILYSIHEASFLLGLPLIILAIGSIFLGYFAKDLFIGLGTPFFYHVLPHFFPEAEFIPQMIKLIPVLFSLIGAISAILLYHYFVENLLFIKWKTIKLYQFLTHKWYFDSVYNEFIIKPIMTFGYQISYKLIDRGLIEFIGPHGLAHFISKWSKNLSQMHTGLIYNYTFMMLIGVIFLISFIWMNTFSISYLLYFIGFIYLLS